MSNPSKRKGNKFEVECVKLAEKHNIPAKRAWGSNGKSLGYEEEVDMLIYPEAEEPIKIQCKIRKVLPKWIIPSETIDVQLIRQDRDRTYAVIDYETYLYLISNIAI